MSNGIDDDYKLAFGSLVMEVSKLDSAVTVLIAALTEMDLKHALILVHNQQFGNKLDGLRALFRLIYPDERDPNYQPIKQMLDHVQTVAEFRNAVVHALWHVDEATGVPHAARFRARGVLKRSQQPAPFKKIREYTRDAIDLRGQLVSLATVYRGYAQGP